MNCAELSPFSNNTDCSYQQAKEVQWEGNINKKDGVVIGSTLPPFPTSPVGGRREHMTENAKEGEKIGETTANLHKVGVRTVPTPVRHMHFSGFCGATKLTTHEFRQYQFMLTPAFPSSSSKRKMKEKYRKQHETWGWWEPTSLPGCSQRPVIAVCHPCDVRGCVRAADISASRFHAQKTLIALITNFRYN